MESAIPRSFIPPEGSFFLFGPRGTGKTTLLNQKFPDALLIDLLKPDVFQLYNAHPERLGEITDAYQDGLTVIIDEIQKIPELLSMVHSLMEQKRNIRFILTGSSTRKIKKTGADMLAGRAVRKNLHPFLACELGEKFKLATSLRYGLLPLVFSARDRDDTLKSYVALYVREEVFNEGLVRNTGNFSRFLESISFSHASVLNISNVARECKVERKVVESYVAILEDLMLAYRIPVFTKRAKREVIAHNKFFFFDAGVFRSLRPAGPLDRPQEMEGCALEGLVAQHLVGWNSYRGEKNKLFYWRTKSGSEVDFIMYGEEVFWAIEVKNTSRVRPEDLKPLIAFKEEYPECKPFFLYRGRERLVKNRILCLPCDEFLMELNPASRKLL